MKEIPKEEQTTRTRVENVNLAVEVEVNKILLSNNLDYFRGLMTILNGISGVLMAAQIRIVVAFEDTLVKDTDYAFGLAPAALFGASLVAGFLSVMLTPARRYTIGDLESTIDAYEGVVSQRKQQLILPSIITSVGLFVMVLFVLTR
ncbi:MAG: hypothetical protein H6821_07215 [Planctomycetaceae bacterium]|nr:hypothetical protein [Planctomycetaceae bacterium]MCB9938583.1 hypothetical protein [Planctomycetaceae bacterium]